jgi:hypothetical protein
MELIWKNRTNRVCYYYGIADIQKLRQAKYFQGRCLTTHWLVITISISLPLMENNGVVERPSIREYLMRGTVRNVLHAARRVR